MSSKAITGLPPLAPFPEVSWRTHLPPEEWMACWDAWGTLVEAHLALSASEFSQQSIKDESLPAFLIPFMKSLAASPDSSFFPESYRDKRLRRLVFALSSRLLEDKLPPERLLQWEYLADLCKVYGKKSSCTVISNIWSRDIMFFRDSMSDIKNSLTTDLESGLKGRPDALEQRLKHLNHLIHSSPDTATFLMSGSDFLDGLVSCYKIMNPPLRKAIISTSYLCLIGLTEGPKANISLLTDQLYALQNTAEAHKAGPTSSNDSLVAELVSVTPILHRLQRRLEESGMASGRTKSVVASLALFIIIGGDRPKRLIKRKVDKGKQVNRDSSHKNDDIGARGQIHVHRLSLISHVQDLFPDLGSGFVVKLLDEYNDDVESVISHLLEDSLPPHLDRAERKEVLSTTDFRSKSPGPDLAPQATPPLLPTRRNIFDNDEFDKLAIDSSRLHFGRRDPDRTADVILRDRSSAPNKAAILSALAAFDSDDDERDDSYDVEDVGGTVDSATPGNNAEDAALDTGQAFEELLFRTFKTSPDVFRRDAATRRDASRAALKEATHMTDEAIEGWALMLSRDPRQLRRFEAKYSAFSGVQRDFQSSAWSAERGGDSGTESSGLDGRQPNRKGNQRRGGRGDDHGRGGRGTSQGNVNGQAGEKGTELARQHKEANKSSRANHNRRDQRARKMARGGFPG